MKTIHDYKGFLVKEPLTDELRDMLFGKEQLVRVDWLMELALRSVSRMPKTQEVLVVEDDENNGELMQVLLGNHGYESMVVKTAAEAMVYCQRVRPIAVMMDIGLPDSDGIQLTKVLKSMPVMDGVPFIAMTGNVSEGMREMGKNVGITDFIEKPWNPEQVMHVMEKQLTMV